MKKTLSLILALIMLLGCMSITAFAAGAKKVVWDENEIKDLFCITAPAGEMVTRDNNTQKGITMTCQSVEVNGGWMGKSLSLPEGGTVIFTSSVGEISKIEITAERISSDAVESGDCPGWSIYARTKLIWEGTPTEVVSLAAEESLKIYDMSQIVFTFGDDDGPFLTSFPLNKDYDDKYTADAKSTKVSEALTYTIAPMTENAPAFDNNGVVTMNVVNGVGTVDVTLPTVDKPGEYWYTLKENAGNTAGVTYDANTYYLHLVTDWQNGEYGVISAQIHTAAPADDGTYKQDDKIDTISNLYAEGSLTIKQNATVNGESSSDDVFTNEVTFKLPEGVIITGNITYGDKTITPNMWKDGSVSVDIDLKGGESVTFAGIPDGTTYTVKQTTDASAMGYDDPVYSRVIDDPDEEGDNVTQNGIEGTVSDLSDTVGIDNHKVFAIDVGVMLEDGGFIVIALGAIMLGAWLVISKRREREYDAE